MTYKEKYYEIINTGLKEKPETGYYEGHHIVPKSICPLLKKSQNNLIYLTAKNHFLAHYYIWKWFKEELHEKKWARKMCYALYRMKRQLLISNDIDKLSDLYEEVRREFSKVQSEEMKGEKNPNFGKHLSEDHKQKLRRPKSELHKQHLRESFKNRDFNGEKNPMYGKNIKDFMTEEDYKKWCHNVGNSRRGKFGVFKCSESTKKKISAANKGRKHTDQARSNMSKSRRKSYYKKLIKKFGFEQAKIEVCKLNSHKGWIRSIHKGYENLRVSKLSLCDYLIDGWKLGHCSRDAIEKMMKTRINQVVSVETREKISKSKKGKKNLKLTGRHLSEETKKKISETRKNMKISFHHSKETIEKIRMSKIGKHIEVIDGKRRLVD